MTKRTRKNATNDLDDVEIVNAIDADRGNLYLMWFGVYRDSRILVWADSFDDAFEHAVDHFDDPKTCGVFTFLTESDYKAAAEDEGIEWPAGGWDDLDDDEQEKIREAAEADLTVIGHTQIQCMPKGAWGAFVHSDEWGGDDVTGEEKKRLRAASLASDDQDEDLTKLGWHAKPGAVGIWTATLDGGDNEDSTAVFYDQRATYAQHGGDGQKVLVEIYQHHGTRDLAGTTPIKSKKFEGVGGGSVRASEPMRWVDEVEDELKWAE